LHSKAFVIRQKTDSIVLNACLVINEQIGKEEALRTAFDYSPYFTDNQLNILIGPSRGLLVQQCEAWSKELGFNSLYAAKEALLRSDPEQKGSSDNTFIVTDKKEKVVKSCNTAGGVRQDGSDSFDPKEKSPKIEANPDSPEVEETSNIPVVAVDDSISNNERNSPLDQGQTTEMPRSDKQNNSQKISSGPIEVNSLSFKQTMKLIHEEDKKDNVKKVKAAAVTGNNSCGSCIVS
jgi:hypothetical protein